MRKAVIDVGSNSLLLTVAERTANDWHTTFESSEVSALGEGTKATGVLGEPGTANTLAALKRAFENARNHNAEPKAFGTMALRIATNSNEFLVRAVAQGTPVEVISGELEAELGLASVTEDPLFTSEKRITIIDPGGHSTEIAAAEYGKETYRQSFPVGTLSLRSGVLKNESPTPADLLNASTEIDDTFRALPSFSPENEGRVGWRDTMGAPEIGPSSSQPRETPLSNLRETDIQTPNSKLQTPVVALGASATNLITIRDHILEWDATKVHGQTLDFETISKFVGSASKLTDTERSKIPGIEKGREKTIHIGALILERALHALHAESCRVSVRGWRYAMLSRI